MFKKFLISYASFCFVLLVSVSSVARSSESSLADIGPAPEVKLTAATTGETFQLSSLRGKAVLVSFIYTTCSGSCPATTITLCRVQDTLQDAGLWGDQVEFVSITLDPENDTAEALNRYARIFDVDTSAWHFLTGSSEAINQTLADWDMWARIGPSGALDHPSRIFLIDPKGRQREIYNLQFLTPEVILHDVRTVLAETSEAGNNESVADGIDSEEIASNRRDN